MMSRTEYGLIVGKQYEVAYPFVRTTFDKWDSDGPAIEISSWKPGVDSETDPYDSGEYADANGAMLLTIVDIHKPGKYPPRVFYLRRWRDPEGKEFGKGALRIKSAQGFKRLLAGYRHPYEIREA